VVETDGLEIWGQEKEEKGEARMRSQKDEQN